MVGRERRYGWYARGDVERPEDYANHMSARYIDNLHVRMAQENDDVLEFHPGPKGKSHANTCRIMGDASASSSSFRTLSRCTGSQAWTSASYVRNSGTIAIKYACKGEQVSMSAASLRVQAHVRLFSRVGKPHVPRRPREPSRSRALRPLPPQRWRRAQGEAEFAGESAEWAWSLE